jgi:hypothetical protein
MTGSDLGAAVLIDKAISELPQLSKRGLARGTRFDMSRQRLHHRG